MSKVEGVKYSFFIDRLIVVLAYAAAILGEALPAIQATWTGTLLDSPEAAAACKACAQELAATEDDILSSYIADRQVACGCFLSWRLWIARD